ncbi:oligosaccharide flippase family protein [Geodermatophilus sp. SYSU D00703]
MSRGLAGVASRGALWLGLVNLLSKGSQVVVTLALGVFLTAGELGTVTVTVALVNLALVLQSAGVYDVIARTSEDPRRFAGTVGTMSVGLAALVALVAVVFAPQIAVLSGAPGATDLLRVAVLSLPFTAFAGVQMAYLHRRLDFGRRLVPDAGSALAGAAVTIASAATGLGEWSLVAGLVTTAVLAPLLGAVVGIRVRPRWSTEHARSAARWAAVTGPGAVLGLVLLNLDYVVISRVLGEAATGVYSFAFRIAFVPYVMGAVVLGGVAFPLYARLMESGGERAMAPAVVRLVHVVTATTGGAYLALALLADRIVVIDPRWAGSAPVLRVLALYGVLLGLVLMGHEALRASGRPGLYLRAQVVHVVVLLAAAVALVRFGIVAVAWAQVGAVAVAALLVAAMLGRADLLGAGLGRALLAPLLAAAVVAALHEAARWMGVLPPADSLVGAAVVGVLVLLAYGGVLVLVDRPLLRDLRAAVAR